MTGEEIAIRDVERLVVPRVGRVLLCDVESEPVRLLDVSDRLVAPVAVFLADLQAAGRPVTTLRSYAMDLLRWFRFLWSVDVAWHRASRAEARDFCRWLAVGRHTRAAAGLAPATRAHAETVARTFYEVHREFGSGPVLNPFPLHGGAPVPGRFSGAIDALAGGRGGQAVLRAGRYRPRVPKRVPRSVPDDVYNRLFAALRSHRDRALVAFYISTGARASELLSAVEEDADPGSQTIWVVRKGSRVRQELPASADAFVWLRLYQQELLGRVPAGRRQPLWRGLRAPHGPLRYHGVHRVITRAAASVGVHVTLHRLRHTAAFRMAQDPQVSLCDVQWVLGHALLSTTQIYTAARPADVIAAVLAHHQRRPERPVPPPPAPGYRPESLQALFGHQLDHQFGHRVSAPGTDAGAQWAAVQP